ncbi:formate/nitrite transporter family protein [Alteraurantiacibacter aquimixticola]|uniref:Formate/nitrite transporter family protein n=1 Tax=Alteraurantiacibacter aquimixticola TaxID=2489173 RepID=A0A4V4U9N0_9SPHN|nr:formate/nitrite transporter family protein [Alteraurantiacibacter aquimixticola]TIX51737.1 formate/nitrite transporter family protein [Alteraurantiacibacter aquimixticola]
MPETPHPLDVVAPAQIARLVEEVGLRKVALPFWPLLTLGVLAGAFIAFGGMFYTVTVTGSELGLGPTRLLGGMAFSLGLVLVIVGGAELFTGNSLIVLALADGKVTLAQLLRNWGIVYLGNLIGSLGTAALVHFSGTLGLGDGAVGATAVAIAEGKLSLSVTEAFARAILCNVLVCLAVWMCFAAHSVSGKVLVILFPITAFVALGFEHSIANMYLIPVGMLHAGEFALAPALQNLAVVTAGNVVGGGVLVALVYWLVYLRPGKTGGS